MTEMYWCRACGGETTAGGRCPACGEELSLLPTPTVAEDDQAVGFELVDWAAPERADLVAWLVASRIPHRLDGDTVYVDLDDESRTDAIIDWVTSPDRGGHERVPTAQLQRALAMLRRAVQSLERDPGLIANPELLDEIQAALDSGIPDDWPIEAWYEVRLLTDRLMNEGIDAPDPLLMHWARRVAWLVRVHGDGRGPSPRRPLPPPPAAGSEPPETPAGLLSWCPSCLYDGVAILDHCPNCGQQLTKTAVPALPEADPDDESVLEVEYRLDGWEEKPRHRLLSLLFEYAVPHRFEGADSLIVGGDSEALADRLVDEASGTQSAAAPSAGAVGAPVGGPGGGSGGLSLASLGEPSSSTDAPTEGDALQRLLDAARTVARTPSAADGPEFTQAALDMLTMNPPASVDRDEWEQAAQLTHGLLHGDPGDAAGAANRAASLVRLVTPWVGAGSAGSGAGVAGSGVAGNGTSGAASGGQQDELVYELGDWEAEQRDQLTLVLDRETIRYSWENGTDLIVDGRDESRIDNLLDEAEGPDDPIAAAESESGEDGYQAISDLFGVCDRLAHRPADKELRAEAVAAAEVVARLSIPYGVSDSDWWQLRTRSRELATELTDGLDDDDVITEHAGTLRDLLRAFL